MSRAERLASLIQKKISTIISQKLNDSRIGFVSITEVRVSGDLQHAKVYYSCFGSEAEKKATNKGIEHSKNYIRSLLAAAIDMKQVPELEFIADDSLERGNKVLQKLKELRQEQ